MSYVRQKRKGFNWRFGVGLSCLAALSLGAFLALSWSGPAVAGSNPGPDVTVHTLSGVANWGAVSGVRAYSVGTTSCNIGDQPLWWCNDAGDTFCEVNQHPVIAQNLYRLKQGRFEQIGMSWLKHGFASLNQTDTSCGPNCVGPPHGGDQLGIGCTDPYGSGLNGNQPLGLRSEINATTGDFPYPYTEVQETTVIDQRVQVKEDELDPALNPGARYWVEGHYIAADDAAANNSLNNASYREVTVSAGSFNLNFAAPTVRRQAAVFAWQAVDPEVEMAEVDVAGTILERFHAARKATPLGGGLWHYEIVVHNMNSDRAARSLSVDFPGATTFTNVGFRDVDHHSGEPYDTTDWAVTMNGATGILTWSTDTFAVDPNANALRWGTMFSFWFDADRSPSSVVHELELFKPGVVNSVEFEFVDEMFTDGFESGDTSSWTSASP